ncbi:MAG TPA: TolC family protein [Elusimicrobiales bacterium]|nr:TolC family protein [Elusimicrobiales bacterium]
MTAACALLAAALLASPAAAAPRELALAAAVDLALQRNNDIRSARGAEDAARHALRSSYGAFLPHVAAEGSWTRLNGPIELDLNGVRGAIIQADQATALALGATAGQAAGLGAGLDAALPSFTTKVQDQSYYNLSLTLAQPLYAGGRLAAASRAKKAALAAAARNTAAVADRVAGDVATGYFRLLLAGRTAQIRREVLDGMKGHDFTALKLYEQGLISRANRLRAQAALAEAAREAAKAARDEELAALLLANLLDVEESSFTLTTDFPRPGAPPDLTQAVAGAMAANPALNILAQSAKQLEARRSAAAGAILPAVYAFGRYEAYKADLTALQPEWAAGIGVKLPLFSGLSDYQDVKEADAQREALARLTDSARELVRTQVRKYHHDMVAAAEQHESLGASLELADENLRLNKLSFAQGVCTSLEVIDAELALGKVKTERYKALYDYTAALADLLRAAGRGVEISTYREKNL